MTTEGNDDKHKTGDRRDRGKVFTDGNNDGKRYRKDFKRDGGNRYGGKRDGYDERRGGKKFGNNGERNNGGWRKERFAGKPRGDDGASPSENDAALPPEKTTKIKLRLDVKDVVRNKPNEGAEQTDDGITILFEDNHILVAVKPQNIPTQADSSGDLDFLSMLKQYLVKKYDKPGEAYLGLLHRLDRPTGGVMIFAKTSKAASRLSEQIRGGDFEKSYAAVVSGKPNRNGLIEHYLFKDTQSNIVSVVPSTLEGAKKAQSEVKTVEEKDGMALLSVKLITGRTHQARVQLKALGSPIVGDTKYAGDKLRPSPHLALWAYKLVFIHPVSGDVMTFVAAPPQEFPWTEFGTDALIDFVKPIDRDHYRK